MPKLTREEMLDIVNILRETLEPVLVEAARHHAEVGMGRVLRMDDYGLQGRINEAISKMVREQVDRHLHVTVSWRGE